MKPFFLMAGVLLLLSGCRKEQLAVKAAGTMNQHAEAIINQQFEIKLNESLVLKSSTNDQENNTLGVIEFSVLNDSRCPANAICMRQGAAVTTFKVTGEAGTASQSLRLFIGDFMANDPRSTRNRTADTVVVQLANKARYQLILKKVTPYPGTSQETPKATLLLEKQ